MTIDAEGDAFLQVQQIPVDIDPRDPVAMTKVIEVARQMVIKQNEFEERIAALENRVLK